MKLVFKILALENNSRELSRQCDGCKFSLATKSHVEVINANHESAKKRI